MSSLQDTVSLARQAWDSNYTLGDKRWRLKQLHGLHQMLVKHRETLVSSMAKDQGVPTIVYEQEIALLVQEISGHLSQLKRAPSKDLFRATAVAQRPWGVTLIICGCPNLIRFALAPLAGAVAAGNVVILATAASKGHTIVSSLAEEWPSCFDPDSVFFVPGFDTLCSLPEGIDQTLIFDTSHIDYTSILTSPTAHFHSSSRGYSFAIIDEGKKDWHEIAQEILANSRSQRLPSDRFSTVFVRQRDIDNLRKALGADDTSMPNGESMASKKQLQALGYRAWSRDIFAMETSTSNLTGSRSKFGLEECLEPAQAAGLLLIIGVSSLDEALDELIASSNPIAQLAILSPNSEKIATYVLKWVDASLVSLGHIYPIPLPVVESPAQSKDLPVMFPPSMFSRAVTLARKPFCPLPTSVPAIRATYEKLISPLQAEARGERVDFFTQVEYMLKSVGATVGLMAVVGCIIGVRATYKRL